MKIYKYFKNTGDWGGCESEYFIANSLEEAKEYPKFLRDKELYESCHWDIDNAPREVTGEDILNALKIFGDNARDVTLEYSIHKSTVLFKSEGEYQKVIHAKWTNGCFYPTYKPREDKKNGLQTAYCANCGITQTVNTYNGKVQFKFCPYCGAKMDL